MPDAAAKILKFRALSQLDTSPLSHLLQVLVNTGDVPKGELHSKFLWQNRKTQLVCFLKHK